MMRSLAPLLLLLGGNSFLLTVTLKNAQLGPGQFAPEEPKRESPGRGPAGDRRRPAKILSDLFFKET